MGGLGAVGWDPFIPHPHPRHPPADVFPWNQLCARLYTCTLACRYFIGRTDIIHELFRHCDSGNMSASLPLVVVGAPGSGKTSLMAAFAKRCVPVSGVRPFVSVGFCRWQLCWRGRLLRRAWG
jgi:hypothetical protein